MAPLASTAAAAATAFLLFSTRASAHFTLDYPPTIGFDEDKESTGPCGGFTPDFAKDTVTDFHVGGDNVAINLLHPQGTWLYRATLDTTTTKNEWTQLVPEIMQTGLGHFCQPAIGVPASWAGQKGLIGLVVDAPDGLLYQCAAVNFVSGAATALQSACTNSSGVTASFITDAKLTGLASSAAATGTGSAATTTASSSSSTTAAATTTSASTTATPNAAPGRYIGGSLPIGSAAGVMAAVLGCAYLLL